MPRTAEIMLAWKRRWGFFDDGNVQLRTAPGKLPSETSLRKRDIKFTDDTLFNYSTYSPKGENLPVPSRKVPNEKANEYDPEQRSLFVSALRRRRARLALDGTAAQDQATNVAYSKSRQKELATLAPNHYLTKEYGMRTAKTGLEMHQQGGMRIDHEHSATYLRDAPDDAMPLFGDYYEKKVKPGGTFDKDLMIPVNSIKVIDKLQAFFGSEWTELSLRSTPTLAAGPGGVHFLCFPSGTDPNDLLFAKTWIHATGSTPSSYDAQRSLHGGQPGQNSLGDPAAPESLDNAGNLKRITEGSSKEVLKSVPVGHPMKQVAQAAANLIEGLKGPLEKLLKTQKDGFDKSLFVESALKNLESLVDMMPASLDNSARFTRLFDVMIDELYLLLATAKPYDNSDFKTTAENALKERAPALKEMTKEGGTVALACYSMSSGMGAIANAIQASVPVGGDMGTVGVGDRDGDQKGEASANYFELQSYLLPKSKALNSKGHVMVATLNPSTPTTETSESGEAWSVKELIAGIKQKIVALDVDLTAVAPLAVIIDVTVEKSVPNAEDNEINKLVKEFKPQIEAGLLIFTLCKSYQKYPSLGAAKVMAGGVSVIGKQDSPACQSICARLQGAQEESDLMTKDEGQLMTHLLACGSQLEQPMLKKAASNANFLASQLLQSYGGEMLYSDDLPFVAIEDRDVNIGGTQKSMENLLFAAGLDHRDSFGFQNTAFLGIQPPYYRINPGQEPESEMVEKLYLLSQIADAPGEVTMDAVTSKARRAAEAAFNKVALRLGFKADAIKQQWRQRDSESKDSKRDPSKDPHEETLFMGFVEEWLLARQRGESEANGDPEKLMALHLKLVTMANKRVTKLPPEIKERQTPLDEDANILLADTEPLVGYGATAGERLQVNYLPNMIASCARLSGATFESAPDRAAVMKLIDLLRGSGMDQVSPETRQTLLGMRVEALLEKGSALTEDDLTLIRSCAKEMPYSEGAAKAVARQLPLDCYAGVETAETASMQKISDSLLDGLSIETKLELAEELLKPVTELLSSLDSDEQKDGEDRFRRTWACARHLARVLPPAGKAATVRTRETLSHHPLHGGETQHVSQTLTVEQVDGFHTRQTKLTNALKLITI